MTEYLRTAPVRSMAFSEMRLRICSRFFCMWRVMIRRMAGLRMSPFLNTLCECEKENEVWISCEKIRETGLTEEKCAFKCLSSHCMMQGRVKAFLHFADTLGLTSALTWEKSYILLISYVLCQLQSEYVNLISQSQHF